MFRENVSLTATKALEEDVIDLMASSKKDLLEKVDGKTFKKKGKDITLDLKMYSERIPRSPDLRSSNQPP